MCDVLLATTRGPPNYGTGAAHDNDAGDRSDGPVEPSGTWRYALRQGLSTSHHEYTHVTTIT